MLPLVPSIGRGNIKVGPIPTFSLPSRFSCPGASSWCRMHCYAARFERIWPNCRLAYSRNLMLTLNTPRFVREMLRAIPSNLPVLRIHVSGDFYASEYINAWFRIAHKRPSTTFWAYTRSWSISSLLEPLEELRDLPNVQLFASVDPGMPDPPVGWRVAYIKDDLRAKGVSCLHQEGKAASCFNCRYCFRPGKGDVVFRLH